MAETNTSGGTLRRKERVPLSVPIRAVWDVSGHSAMVHGRTVNISETGVAMVVPDPIPVQTVVSFEANRIKLHGSANVRYIKRKGLNHLVGMEFLGSLRWKMQPAEAL